MVGQKRENVWASTDFFPGKGQESTFRLKNNKKDTIFHKKKSKNILLLASFSRKGMWGGKSPPCPHSGRPWLNVVDFLPPYFLFPKLSLPILLNSMLSPLFPRCQNDLIHVFYIFFCSKHISVEKIYFIFFVVNLSR
jgi:hypothetical protein